MKEYEIICCCCGSHLDIDEVHYMADQPYCSDCLDEVTSVCYECGTRLYNIDIVVYDQSQNKNVETLYFEVLSSDDELYDLALSFIK